MTGEAWFTLYCVIAALLIITAALYAVLVSRPEAYVTFDCLDGAHSACESCDCDCHELVLA